MTRENVYHQGEIEVQIESGEQHIAAITGRIIKDEIDHRAGAFISNQPMIVLGSIDEEQFPWASLFFGNVGFVQVKSPKQLAVYKNRMLPNLTDEFWRNLKQNACVGSLFIDLFSRKRYRVNGTLDEGENVLTLSVREAYANCPKYIQARKFHFEMKNIEVIAIDNEVETGTELNAEQKKMIENSDTFFIASYNPETGADISHRGGKRGFVQVLQDGTLRVPDYKGNGMFNTLGNLKVHPKAGLIFYDFEKGETLQLIGNTVLHFKFNDPLCKTGGTNRAWDFKLVKWVHTKLDPKANWDFVNFSPHLI